MRRRRRMVRRRGLRREGGEGWADLDQVGVPRIATDAQVVVTELLPGGLSEDMP